MHQIISIDCDIAASSTGQTFSRFAECTSDSTEQYVAIASVELQDAEDAR